MKRFFLIAGLSLVVVACLSPGRADEEGESSPAALGAKSSPGALTRETAAPSAPQVHRRRCRPGDLPADGRKAQPTVEVGVQRQLGQGAVDGGQNNGVGAYARADCQAMD